MFKEFREFAAKGNVVDMAVGIVIGAAFGTIVKSFVEDIIMPPIGLMMGKVDFTNLFLLLKDGKTPGPYASLADAKAVAAVTLNYGAFISTVVSFLILAFSVFLVVKSINKIRREQTVPPPAPQTKDCPFCFSAVHIKAVRCPQCTAELK